MVSTFRFHAIGVWTPKTIGRASRAFRNINVHIYFCLQKRDSLEELIALSLRVGLVMLYSRWAWWRISASSSQLWKISIDPHCVHKRAVARGAMSCRNVNAAKQHANAVTRIERTGNREKEIQGWQTGVLSANKARVQSCVEPVSIPRAKRSNL